MGHWSNAGTEAFKRHGSLVNCLLSPIVKNSIQIFTVCVGKVLQDFCVVSSLLWDFLVDTTHDLPVLRVFFYCEREVQEFLLRGVKDFVNILVRMLKQYRYQLAPSILGPSVFLIWKKLTAVTNKMCRPCTGTGTYWITGNTVLRSRHIYFLLRLHFCP